MTMTSGQLSAFRTRMMKAAGKGRAVACSMDYVSVLANMGADASAGDAAPGSAAHLMGMADQVLSGAKPKKKAKAAPKPAAPPPAPKPADPPPASEPPDSEEDEPYEAWTKKELYDEAAERDIDGRSAMDKDELIAALEASDAEPE